MRGLVLAGTLWLALPALAQDDDAALRLADRPGPDAAQPSDWRVFAEAAVRSPAGRTGGRSGGDVRFSLDLRLDKALAPAWRLVLADRADLDWQGRMSRENGLNTLKEAYTSWQPQAERIADFGRINARQGVALGYNPTDYFRARAVRSVVSIDPASLRENRLGSVMLRGQALWEGGSASALFSPRLADSPSAAPLSLDLGATNSRRRALFALTHAVSDGLRPQWLLYSEAGQPPQIGVNVTGLLNDATVGYFEWSGGRARSLASRALGALDDTAFRSRLAAGATYATAFKLSVTAEYEYSGAALDRTGWDALRRGPPARFARYRTFAAEQRDLPTRRNLFLYATWQDAVLNHLDVSAMLRGDLLDRSRLTWLEARYRWTSVEAALQWEASAGAPGSNFGALPERRAVQALVRYFF